MSSYPYMTEMKERLLHRTDGVTDSIAESMDATEEHKDNGVTVADGVEVVVKVTEHYHIMQEMKEWLF